MGAIPRDRATLEHEAVVGKGINRVWAELIIEELVRQGITMFCLAPGYRSAPLALAAARHPKASAVVHYDERGAAFFALGYARATGSAAGWITTSGTAVANGLPAIVEADAGNIPVVLLTADRPPELRKTGANQAIDQAQIFQRYVRWSVDLPAPSATVNPAFVLTSVDQTCSKAHHMYPGPVHVNCMFRAPLVDEDPVPSQYLMPVRDWQHATVPYTQYVPAVAAADVEEVAARLITASRVLVIIGRLKSRDDGEAALAMAEACHWPVYADINSQVRLGRNSEVLMDSVALGLCHDSVADRLVPEAVLHIGAPLVSKEVQQFLSRNRPRWWVVIEEGLDRLDPTHQVSHRVQGNVASACRLLQSLLGEVADPESSWLEIWQVLNARAKAALEKSLEASDDLSEPFVARCITRHIPADHGLVLGNSLPVRLADWYAAAGEYPTPVVANRGASGIDGTLATAAGAARGWKTPVTVLLGDLAMLHDINSLALLQGQPVIVVVINNDGGGLFHFVEISVTVEKFEQCFGTPHGLEFENAARMYGLSYYRPHSREDFMAVYLKACEISEPAVIEVRTRREDTRELHQSLTEHVSAAVVKS